MADDSVKLTIRNATDGRRVFTDIVSGQVEFGPGEVKTLDVSKAEAEKYKEGHRGWEPATEGEGGEGSAPVA
jgi:hypothetical protein